MIYRSTRFLAVLSSPLPTRTILYNPLLMKHIRKSEQLSDTDLLEKMIFTPSDKGSETLQAELFHPFWKCTYPGSGRHLSRPPLQMKGVGKSLSMNYDEFGEIAGKMELSHAIRAFLLANLLDSTLITGSALAVSVQQVKGQKDFGVYTRILDCPRLAALGPDLSEDEKKELIEILFKKFPESDLRGIQKQIIASYAALAFLSGMTNATADNLLLDGSCIDEESLFWPRVYGEASLHFETFIDSGKIRTSSFTELESAITNLLRAFSLFLDGKDVLTTEEAFETFYKHLLSLSSDRSLLEIWKIKTSPKELEAQGWSVISRRTMGNISSLTLSKNLVVQSTFAHDFNRPHRTYLHEQMQKFLNLTKDEAIIFDAAQFSSTLFTWIGKSAFLLPVRSDKHGSPVPNTMTAPEFWDFTCRKWDFTSQDIELHAWNGKTTVILKRFEIPSEDLIPLYLKCNQHIVHAYKTIIKGNYN